jgi:cell wall-associated NlpC family hydrolase
MLLYNLIPFSFLLVKNTIYKEGYCMRNYKLATALALLLSLSVTLVTPAYAVSLTDLVPQTTNTATSSTNHGIFDILLGLLLGKMFGNVTNTNSGATNSATSPTNKLPNSVLGVSSNAASQSTGNAIVETAKKYMGVPYVWGGATPDGWDCSGFTQYVMKENGIKIPRTAAEQFATGTSVEKSNLQVGDLVFFTTYKPGASHVGFYLGNGNFIHASSTAKKVTISALDEQYFTEHYIGARRYTN